MRWPDNIVKWIAWAALTLTAIGLGARFVMNAESVKGHVTKFLDQRAGTTGEQEPQEPFSMGDLPQRLLDSSFFKLAFSSEQARAEYLLEAFRRRFRGTGDDGRVVLDAVQVVGLAPTVKNAKALREALSETNSVSERVALIRLLGSIYSQLDDAAERQAILNDLRGLCASEVPEISRSAVLAYARLGYLPDTLELLASARSSGGIGPVEYSMELAHLLPLAPEGVQLQIARDLAAGGSVLSQEIVASSLLNPVYASAVPKDVAREVFKMLAENEPVFSGSPQAYGLSDAIRYAEWLQGTANLNQALTGESQQSYLRRLLLDDNADPRKLVAAAQLMNLDAGLPQTLGPEATGKVAARVARFAADGDQQSVLGEAASVALERLRGRQ